MKLSGIQLTGIIIGTVILTLTITAIGFWLYMRKKMKEMKILQKKVVNSPQELMKDPHLQKQLEELAKRFGGIK